MMAKIVASDSLWAAADDLVETLGGRGYMENNIAPQIMRDCRMLRIGEGANELMTLSVGRRIFHSEKLHEFLRDRLGCPELSDRLRDASQRIQHRCLSPAAPFKDRSAALSWAYNLLGRVAIKGVVMAAARATARCNPSALLQTRGRLGDIQFETALAEALRGPTTESFLLGAAEITGAIAGYAEAIGDIEQAPPGIEEAVDPLLPARPGRRGIPQADPPAGERQRGRPGHRAGPGRPGESLTAEQKRQLAAQLLRRRSSAVVEATLAGP